MSHYNLDVDFEKMFDSYLNPSITGNATTFPEHYDLSILGEVAQHGDLWAVEQIWRIEQLIEIKKKALNGNAESQFDLAEVYYHKKQYDDAITWYKSSAIKGHSVAQWMTGNLYHYGQGVDKNCEEAKKWWTLAAQQEFKPAQQILKIINKKE